jgi:hypothetical protein
MNIASLAASVRQRVGRALPASTEQASEDEFRTGLFVCPDCDVVYISEEMRTCSTCGGSVEGTPTGRDLGLH